MLDWAEEAPQGIGAKNPSRMKWKAHIETAFYLMDEKGYGQAEARQKVAEKEGLTKLQALSFKGCFNAKCRERREKKS